MKIYTSERDKAIFKQAIGGQTYPSIGMEYGVGAERVRQIIVKVRVRLRRRMSDEDELITQQHGIKEMRQDTDRWLRLIDRL